MRKIIKKICLALLVFLTAFPFRQEVFASAPSGPGLKAESAPPPMLVRNPVRVLSAPILGENPTIAVQAAGSCEIPDRSLLRTFVQDPDLVNFNLPAGCYSLSLGRVAVSGKLEVLPLAAELPEINLAGLAGRIFLLAEKGGLGYLQADRIIFASALGEPEGVAILMSEAGGIAAARAKIYIKLNLAFLGVWRC